MLAVFLPDLLRELKECSVNVALAGSVRLEDRDDEAPKPLGDPSLQARPQVYRLLPRLPSGYFRKDAGEHQRAGPRPEWVQWSTLE